MKPTVSPMTLVIAFAVAFALGIVPRAQAQDGECSDASLEGSFGFASTGTLLALPPPLAGPFGEVGRQTFDGQGNTNGTATASNNGNVARLTFDGTYVVNPDCTGSMTLKVLTPFTATFNLDFVIDDNGNELRAITTGPTGNGAPGNVESRVYNKQFQRRRNEWQ